ncbi:hypothetical protein CZ794_05245 [Psychrobacter sp. JB385]|nr:hypothetical protein CZ794_05245 [Psychrobacter sp. JB385]
MGHVRCFYATFDRAQNSGKITASYQTNETVFLVLVKRQDIKAL